MRPLSRMGRRSVATIDALLAVHKTGLSPWLDNILTYTAEVSAAFRRNAPAEIVSANSNKPRSNVIQNRSQINTDARR